MPSIADSDNRLIVVSNDELAATLGQFIISSLFFVSLLNLQPRKKRQHPPIPSALAAHSLHNNIHRCLWLSVDCCIRAPLGARAYPWILSKYCPSVRASVRASMRPPTNKHRVYIVCKTISNFCGIIVVFCSNLERCAIPRFSSHVHIDSYIHSFFCTEVLSM
jgi:hypothetical protein